MPTNRLTEAGIRSLKPRETTYKISDCGGLNLLVQPTGSKLWRLSYRFGGKQKTLACGVYPSVTLAAARQRRAHAKDALQKGADPAAKPIGPVEPAATFQNVATRWFGAREGKWSSGHAARVWGRVAGDLVPALGAMSVSQIQPSNVLSALRAIEARQGAPVETAHRVKQYAADIFAFAKAEGLVKHNPVVDLEGALSSRRPVKHRAAVKAADLPALLTSIANYHGERQTALALRFVLLTFVRSSELRFAKWAEFEGLESAEPIWRIPAERMKMRQGHLVPLSPQAIRVLADLRAIAQDSAYVVPGQTRSGVISENTMIYALYRMGWATRATVHGFRGTASTILNEAGFNRDWIERQLAHTERDEVRAAYNSAEWLVDRRRMMVWWGDYLDSVVGL